MTRGAAAVHGFCFGAAGITLAGAIWGAAGGGGFCCGPSNVCAGALIGGIGALVVASIPAGVIGALVVACLSSLFEIPEPALPFKPGLHPLDDWPSDSAEVTGP